MGRVKVFLIGMIVGGLIGSTSAPASRCGSQAPPLCGLDSQTDPPDPMLGGTGGCTEKTLSTLPLWKATGACEPGWTKVVYDIAQPFPDNGVAGDSAVVGSTSFFTMRADPSSACGHMIDSVDPKPCPDPQECPDPMSPQPEGAIKVPLTGFAVACFSPLDHHGCRELRIHTGGSLCLHAESDLLGPTCTQAGDVDCPNVSTEMIAVDVPGGSNHHLCPPADSTMSCRATKHHFTAGGLRFRIGGFCTTMGCENPGTAPEIGPDTCRVSWGASIFGYDVPMNVGIDQPGWYDWKTGAWKVDLSAGRPTCGALQACLGENPDARWDLRVVAVPRPGQQVPCLGDPNCDAPNCVP